MQKQTRVGAVGSFQLVAVVEEHFGDELHVGSEHPPPHRPGVVRVEERLHVDRLAQLRAGTEKPFVDVHYDVAVGRVRAVDFLPVAFVQDSEIRC